MSKQLNFIHICASISCLYAMIYMCNSERKLFINLERPMITRSNPRLVRDIVFKSRRVSRDDPLHYVTLNLTTLQTFDNKVKIHFFIYELLSNVYKRSFVEWHVAGCDFLDKDSVLAPSMRATYKLNGYELKCPVPPGNYSFPNMHVSMTAFPANFPFQSGRIYANVTRQGELAANGHIDFQIKSYNAEKQTGQTRREEKIQKQ